jgi:hypothetical protein
MGCKIEFVYTVFHTSEFSKGSSKVEKDISTLSAGRGMHFPALQMLTSKKVLQEGRLGGRQQRVPFAAPLANPVNDATRRERPLGDPRLSM